MELKGLTTYEVPWWYFSILIILSLFLKLWYATIRFKYSENTYQILNADKRVIVLIWHNRIFITPMLRRHFRKNHRMSGLVSPSKDGAWLAGLFKMFNVEAIRGSSKRRGGVAIKLMLEAIADGSDICITPDGPRGPKYSIKKGALKVAELSNADILIIRAKYRKFFRLKTWDDFMLPLPFSAVELDTDPLINFNEVCFRAEDLGLTPEAYIENALSAD